MPITISSPNAFTPAMLFASGEPGAWYDINDLSTLFEDSGATISAHVPGNGTTDSTIGSILDKRNTTYSTYFLDNTDSVSYNGESSFAFGTGDFTVEMWFWPTVASYTRYLYDGLPNGTSSGAYLSIAYTGSNMSIYAGTVATGGGTLTVNYALRPNQWYHIAVVRYSGTTRLYVNGVERGSGIADTTDYLNGASRPIIGKYGFTTGYNIGGYLNNVRVVKGTAVYTGNFTVPTSPLTAISGTSLLAFGINWSGNPKPSLSSTPRISGITPFVTAYSDYFDGTGDSLTIADSAALEPGSGNFTVEAWIYLTQTSGSLQTVVSKSSAGFGPFLLTVNGTSLVYYCSSNNTSWDVASAVAGGTLTTNSWNHVALVRNGNTITPYLNGVAGTATTSSATLTNNTGSVRIGANYNGTSTVEFINGYISNFRYVVGTAVYTGNFTVPTARLTAITNTQILTCGNDTWDSNPAVQIDGDTKPHLLNPFATLPVVYGNHLIQTTSSARPTLSARYNLLTYTEQFDNAAWTKSSGSITSNAITAPDGTVTADLFTAAAGAAYHAIYNNPAVSIQQGLNYTLNVYLKAGTQRYLQLNFGPTSGSQSQFGIIIDTTTMAIVTTGAGISGTYVSSLVTNVGSGWYRFSLTGSITGSSSGYLVIAATDITSYSTNPSNASGGGTFYLWGADMRPANDGLNLPVYQRISDTSTYDSTGFPYYLKFDGTDDVLSSDDSFMPTGNVTMFTASRASIAYTSTFGSILGYGKSGTVGANFGAYYGGDNFGQTDGVVAGTWGTGFGFSNYTLKQVVFTINRVGTTWNIRAQGGSSANSRTISYSTILYGAGGLTLGRGSPPNGGSFLNGRIYGAIILGASPNAIQIANAESWLNNKMKAY